MDNRRKTIVVNKKFQYQYSLLIVSLTILVLNFFLIAAFLHPEFSALSISATTAVVLGIAELILLLGVWYASIRISHRIAGPIYVATRQIAAFCDGDYSSRVKLRKNDLFQPEVDEINASLDKLAAELEKAKVGERES